MPDFVDAILKKDNWVIYKDGIKQESKYISWNSVKNLYLGGMKGTVNFIFPAGEKWELKIVDSSDNTINIRQSSFLSMSNEKKDEFFEIYKYVVGQVFETQWAWFQQQMQNKQKIHFNKLYLDSKAIYYKSFLGRSCAIPFTSLVGHFITNGYFYINYRKFSGKIKQIRIGLVSSIPNVYILQAFIDMHSA
jgi:hypothetical protein